MSTARETGPDLTGRIAFVIGGSGGVGEGVVRSLLAAGGTVVATGRTPGRLDDLARRIDGEGLAHGRLHVTVLDALSPGLDSAVEALVAAHGRPDLAVVSVASWGDQGRRPVLTLTDAEWEAQIAVNQTAIFRLYRALVPALQPRGALVQLNGMSAEIPFPGAAVRALTAAATKSLTRTVAVELDGRGPRVYELILGMIRTRERQAQGIDDARWVDGTDVGDHVARLLAGTDPLAGTVVQYLVDESVGAQADLPLR